MNENDFQCQYGLKKNYIFFNVLNFYLQTNCILAYK